MPNDKLAGLLIKKDSNEPDDNSGVQPLAPPAPPPLQTITAQNNPYDFITNPASQPKKKLFPGGNSLTSRLIFIGGGVVILFLIGMLVISLLNSGAKSLKNEYTSLVLQQAELIRVSDIGVEKARQSKAKNLAITTRLSLTSQQPDLLALAKKAGAPTEPKILATGADAKTDTLLTTADQSNQFDEEFTKFIYASLLKYQQSLKNVYDATSKTSTKDTLSKNFNAVNVLLKTQDE